MNVMILVYAHACWLLFNDKLSLVSPVLVATPVKTLHGKTTNTGGFYTV